MPTYNTPDLHRAGYARTNRQTIGQRATLIRELLPATRSIAELCCGDCTAQWAIDREALPGLTFCGLDVAPVIIAANRAAGVPCVCGDALDPAVLQQFLAYDVVFFGLRLIHHSDAAVTGAGIPTEPRRKYVELRFSNRLPDVWEARRSGPDASSMPMELA
jgi:hypothetical protein